MIRMASNVKAKFDAYPEAVKPSILGLREIIFKVAKRNNLGELEETLKWGELAYLAAHGSTLRLDWKAKTPNKLYLFFNCKTSLVETFKEVFFDVFVYSENRAIILDVDAELAVSEIEECILMTLTYHKIKHLPLLGST